MANSRVTINADLALQTAQARGDYDKFKDSAKSIDTALKLDTSAASRDADRLRLDESRKGITEKLKLDMGDTQAKLLALRDTLNKTIGKLSIDPTLDDKKALAQSLALRVKLDAELKKAGVVDIDIRTDRALAQMAKFDVEASVLEKRIGGDGGGNSGGIFSNLLSNLPIVSRLFSNVGQSAEEAGSEGATAAEGMGSKMLTVLPIALALVPVMGAITTEAAGLLAGLTAAGVGAGAFALLAYPAIEKVAGALGDNKAQIAKLPPGLASAVTAVQGLEGEWHKLSSALEPEVFTLIDKGVATLDELLPAVVPFAQTFAGFLGKIADEAKNFAVSSGFKGFLADLHSIEGPALDAIATGFEHIGGNIGKLLTVMSQKDVVNALNIAFSIIDGTIIALTGTVEISMKAWDHAEQQVINMSHDIADAWRNVEGWTKDFVDAVTNDFDSWRHNIAGAVDDVTTDVSGAWSRMTANVTGWTKAFVDGITNDFDAWRHDVASDVDLVTSEVSGTWNRMIANVEGWTKDGWDSVTATFDAGRHEVAGIADGLYSDVTSGAERLWHAVTGFVDSMWGDIKSDFSSGVAEVGRLWSGIEGAISGPVKFVVNTVYDGGIARFWNDIAGHIGLPKLPTFSFAGGGVVPGGIHGRDSVPIMAAPGELVIPSSHAAMFADSARKASIPGFASGGTPAPVTGAPSAGGRAGALGFTPVTGGPNVLGALASGLAGLWNNLLAKGAAAVLGGILNPLVSAIPSGSSQLSQIPKDLAKSVVSAIISTISSNPTVVAGPNSGPLGPGTGSELANGSAIFKYLMAYAHMTPIAAAGAIASIWGESTWNPFAVGTGGRGLIGWTPEGTISNAAFQGGLATQLPQIIRFISSSGDWGVISEMNKATSVFQAANEWGKGVERYGINDVHPEGIALATGIMNQFQTSGVPTASKINQVKPHSGGGVITEPVYGLGAYSGTPYSFAENGQPEFVSNQSQAATNNPNNDQLLRIAIQNMTGQLAVIARQNASLPNVIGRAIGSAGGAGMAHGYYTAQN